MINVEIIIVSFNTKRYLKNCLESILRSDHPIFPKITVVDNGSTDGSIELIEEDFPTVKLIINESNLGYGAAMNKGIKDSKADILILSNSDLYFHPDTISKSVDFLRKNDNVGIMGAQLIYTDKSWQKSFNDFPSLRSAFKNIIFMPSIENWIRRFYWTRSKFDHYPIKVDWITGAFMVCRAEVIKKINAFDEDYIFYSEDTDICKKVSLAGHDVIFNPTIEVTHVEGGSSNNSKINPRNIELLAKGLNTFTEKHLLPLEKSIFILSKIFESSILLFVSKILSLFKSSFNNKSKYYKEFIRQLKAIY